jgi:hypothetical protein
MPEEKSKRFNFRLVISFIETDDSATGEGSFPSAVPVASSRLGASRRVASEINKSTFAFTLIDAVYGGVILGKGKIISIRAF